MNGTAGRVVVGVDGSESSHAALEWAAGYAVTTGSVLVVVTTWQWPKSYGYPLPVVTDFDPAAPAAKVVGAAVDEARAAHPGLEVDKLVAEGNAAGVLVEASKDAQLLVVGCRGHGELVGLLIGSVSEYCVTHAHCPVLVMRP